MDRIRMHRYTIGMKREQDTDREILARQAWEIWDDKAKPQLSLGRLEQIAVDIVCMRGELHPKLGRPAMLLFAADHGIVEEKVSSSPQEITWQQCTNFACGGGAIALLCRINGIDLTVIDVGVAHEFPAHVPIVSRKVRNGTRNFAKEPAMTGQELASAMDSGVRMVRHVHEEGRAVVAFGEMGIGNTTSSSAVMACLTGISVERCTGRGAGLSADALAHKKRVIADAISLHGNPDTPEHVLRIFGGYEMAAITGGMLEAARRRMVILVDGFIASTAALVAIGIDQRCKDHMLFCHESDEGGHRILMEHLHVRPILSLSMRLGEGTGAAVGWTIIRQAMALYEDMTSFDAARVTNSVALLKEQGVSFHA